MKVLLIQADAATAQSIEMMLKCEGFNTYATDLGEEGADLAKIYDYDAILLDPTLPDMNGIDVLRDLRRSTITTPVLILTRSQRVEDEVSAFAAGADDLIRMPFHRDVLVARLHAVIRRSKGHASDAIEAGPILVDIGAQLVRINGLPLHLTGKEYALMEALALRKGLVLSKEQIMNHLYGGMDEPELKIVDVFACKIRNKLRPLGAAAHLETSWGRGYRLVDAPGNPVAFPRRGRGPVQEAILATLKDRVLAFEAIRRAVPWASTNVVRTSLSTLVSGGEVLRLGTARNTAYSLPEREAVAA